MARRHVVQAHDGSTPSRQCRFQPEGRGY
jgi:hypothetical protein